ncbi:MAG: M23 family metallopeptidase [bacterium]|nr:M23 family metallopeptidase [bacterium]
MKKKLVLKPFVLPLVYAIFVLAVAGGILVSSQLGLQTREEDYTYVSGTILDEYIPVVNTEVTILRPYSSEGVKIAKDYYDYRGQDQEQTNSIIYHENTYLQNTGVDYQQEQVFDVISILDGEVIEVEEKELLGKSVTIKHNNEIISVYQSLSDTTVKKGDQVSAGQIIGKSGSCDLNKELQNHLHFELTVNGQLVDPENYFGKKLSEINQ